MTDRLTELFNADIDYSMPIDGFARKAKALFNKTAKAYKIKIKVYAAEYGDGSARLYIEEGGYDSLSNLGAFLTRFEKDVIALATAYKKLAKLDLPVISVTLGYGAIDVNF